MAGMTLTQMLADFRYETGDTESANYGLDDTVATALLNKAIVLVRGSQDDRSEFITAASSGLVTSGGQRLYTFAVTNIRRIVRLYPTTSSSSTVPTGVELERWEQFRLFQMQGEDTTTGQPSAYAAWKVSTTAPSSVGRWSVGLWRIPDATYNILAEVVTEPTALASGTDRANLDDISAYAVTMMAAGIGARLLGRPQEFIAHIESKIPPALQAAKAQMVAENIVP